MNFPSASEVNPEAALKAVSATSGLEGLTGYINAGGRGTRLASIFTPDEKLGVTKALLKPAALGGKTMVEHHIDRFLEDGVDTVIAGVGDHLHAKAFIDELYRAHKRVHAIHSATQLGNGGDLIEAVRNYPDIFSDNLFVGNVDTFIDIDRLAVFRAHLAHVADLTFVLTLNEGVPNFQAFYVDEDGKILFNAETTDLPPSEDILDRTTWRGSSSGSLVITKETLQRFPWTPEDGEIGLYRDIVGHIVEEDHGYAYNNGYSESFVDVGTVDTWQHVNDPLTIINEPKGLIAES